MTALSSSAIAQTPARFDGRRVASVDAPRRDARRRRGVIAQVRAARGASMDGVVGRFTLTRSLARPGFAQAGASGRIDIGVLDTSSRNGRLRCRSGIVDRRTDVDRAFDFTLLR